jgi:hypothetical protein
LKNLKPHVGDQPRPAPHEASVVIADVLGQVGPRHQVGVGLGQRVADFPPRPTGFEPFGDPAAVLHLSELLDLLVAQLDRGRGACGGAHPVAEEPELVGDPIGLREVGGLEIGRQPVPIGLGRIGRLLGDDLFTVATMQLTAHQLADRIIQHRGSRTDGERPDGVRVGRQGDGLLGPGPLLVDQQAGGLPTAAGDDPDPSTECQGDPVLGSGDATTVDPDDGDLGRVDSAGHQVDPALQRLQR